MSLFAKEFLKATMLSERYASVFSEISNTVVENRHNDFGLHGLTLIILTTEKSYTSDSQAVRIVSHNSFGEDEINRRSNSRFGS